MKKYKHPIYDNVSATKSGDIYINGVKAIPFLKQPKNYLAVGIRVPKYINSNGNASWVKIRSIHQLVYECITKKTPKYATPGLCINHINNNRSDNRFCNLELIHSSENTSLGKKYLYVVANGSDVYAGSAGWLGKQLHGRIWRLRKNGQSKHHPEMKLLAYQKPYDEFVRLP
jgi:hypothetical protein